ncbi:MAG: DUF998 domain-containing protein [Candidatus Thermoplasmatota archaeon]
MFLKNLISPKIAGLCGLLAPIIAFTCIGIAIYYSPWFSWTENWLSDLGGKVGEKPIWSARGIASIIFNIGPIIAGAIGIFFALYIMKSNISNKRLGRLGSLILLLNMFALCAIGIFPETTGFPHGLASITFFFLAPLSLLLIGITLKKFNLNALGFITIILSIVSFIALPFLFVPRPFGSNAIVEMFPAVSMSAFAIIFGIRILKGFEL